VETTAAALPATRAAASARVRVETTAAALPATRAAASARVRVETTAAALPATRAAASARVRLKPNRLTLLNSSWSMINTGRQAAAPRFTLTYSEASGVRLMKSAMTFLVNHRYTSVEAHT